MNLKFHKTRDVKSPTRGTRGSAGIDFYIPNDFTVENKEDLLLCPGRNIVISSGIKVSFEDPNYALIAFNKSGIASMSHLIVGACVIDSDYRGEVHIDLHNIGNEIIALKPGMKIVQFILTAINPCDLEEVVTEEELWKGESERGEGGFGSTGVS